MISSPLRMSTLRITVGLLVFVGGCATVATMPQHEREALETRTIQALPDEAFSAVLDVLQDRGFTVAFADRDAGVISTDYRLISSTLGRAILGNVQSKVTVNIRQLNDAQSRVRFTMITERPSSYGGYENMSDFLSPEQYAESCDTFFTLLESKLPKRIAQSDEVTTQ